MIEEKRREEKRREEKRRDLSLDYLRGLAAINIIFIHTCFFSGGAYVPVAMQSLSLIIDVPFFFFLSGWSFSYVRSFAKSVFSLIDTYKKYIIFLLFYILLLVIIGLITNNYQGVNIKNLYSNLFFINNENTLLPGIMWSIWFLPIYFVVVPICSLLITILWQNAKQDEELLQKYCLISLFIVSIGLLYNYLGYNFFIFSRNILFYMFFYLLGFVCRNTHIKRFTLVISFVILDILVMKILEIYLGLDISVMQNNKFPPNIIYLFYSFITVFVALWLKEKLKNISVNNFFARVTAV